jgi:histidinol-phosphatase
MLVAEGSLDAAVDAIVEVWDVAALKPIVEEAGGRLTDLAGSSRIDGGSCVSSNGLVHEAVLAALGAGPG